jgi:hypothetical protein
VPEYELFSLLQRQRRSLVAYMDSCSSANLDQILAGVMRTALRTPAFAYSGWTRVGGLGTGLFSAERAELKVDVQAAEVMWRNDELKPVPDSIVQVGAPRLPSRTGGRALN